MMGEVAVWDARDKAHPVKRNMAWLEQAYWPIEVLEPPDEDKARYGGWFRLESITVTAGDATLTVEVFDENGKPMPGMWVANFWPDAPDPIPEGLASRWKEVADLKRTDERGQHGYGLGPGSYVRDVNVGGPHWVWVVSPFKPSTCAGRLGMKGGTNHEGPLRVRFVLTLYTGPESPSPTPPHTLTPGDVSDALRRVAEAMRDLSDAIEGLADAIGGTELSQV